MAAHQAPPSLGFSRQELWSGLPFPSPMHESEKWKWSHSVMSNSLQLHGLQPTRLLRPWDFPGKSTVVGCHCLLWSSSLTSLIFLVNNPSCLTIDTYNNLIYLTTVCWVKCQPQYASYCTVLLYFSRYCIVKLKMVSLYFVFLCFYVLFV